LLWRTAVTAASESSIPTRWRNYAPLKHQYLFTIGSGVTYQKTLRNTAVREWTSNLTKFHLNNIHQTVHHSHFPKWSSIMMKIWRWCQESGNEKRGEEKQSQAIINQTYTCMHTRRRDMTDTRACMCAHTHTHTHTAYWWSRQRHIEAAVLHIFIHYWLHTVLMLWNFNTKYIPSRLSHFLKTNKIQASHTEL
jgi:hypothetical protein